MKKPAKTKPTRAWAAVSPSGFIAKWTVSSLREASRSKLVNELYQQTWRQADRDGWRVVRVEIRVVK